VEVSVPKREGQYIGEIEMETDYEVSENDLSSTMNIRRNTPPWFLLLKAKGLFSTRSCNFVSSNGSISRRTLLQGAKISILVKPLAIECLSICRPLLESIDWFNKVNRLNLLLVNGNWGHRI